VKNSADLLFTVGKGPNFCPGAKIKGMAEDKIFQFNSAKEAGAALQSEIRKRFGFG